MKLPRTLAVAFVAMLVMAAASPALVGTAAAHHEEDGNPLDEILEEDEPEEESGFFASLKQYIPSYLVDSMAVFDGQLQRFYSGLGDKNPLGEDPKTNEELAQEFDRAVEDREGVYIDRINEEINASSTYDTHKITIAHESSEPQVVYLVADIENQSVQSARVLSTSEFNETNRTVNVEWVVDGQGAQELPTLTHELADRISEGRSLDRSQQAQLVGRYCDVTSAMSDDSAAENCDIRSSLWMNHESLYEGVDDES